MIKWYTCFSCGFPFMADDKDVPKECPTCNEPMSQFLAEPMIPGARRRIFVEPPKPDPDRDPMDTSYHCPKEFPLDSANGRLRKFVLQYDDAKKTREFYENVFDWDIIDTRVENPMHPLLYAATGPGNANWEPSAPSFMYGFLRAKRDDITGKHPSYVIEVDDIAETCKKIEENGGKILKECFKVGYMDVAIVEDTEGNAFYLNRVPDACDWHLFTPDVTPAIFGRKPKKYPRRSLHGRVRGISIPYRDQERIRRFYVNVFGWDMVKMPCGMYGVGSTPELPAFWAASGPAQAVWEGKVPGHVTPTLVPRKSESDKTYIWMEIDSCREAVQAVIESGGQLISGREDGKEWDESVGEAGGDWSNTAIVDDAEGNRIIFWQCPESRTWEEPEATHDMDFEQL